MPSISRFIMRIFVSFVVLALFISSALCQEKSVRPGINKPFQNPDVNDFLKKFEVESREIYSQRHEIVAACNLKQGMSVADIGAGTGLFSRLFAKAVGENGKVYAVDIAPEFIRHIEKTSQESGLKNVVGVVCDQTSVRLPPQSIDLAFICDTYHHFEFPARTMASIHRALRPGGQLILIDFHRIPNKSSEWVLGHVRAGQEVFVKEIVSTGFKQVEEKAFLKENYFVRFEKVATRQPAGVKNEALARIAFGSCARQDRPQPIWDAVIETDPELFLFLGDNIYADTTDMTVMRAKYDLLGKQPGYRALKKACHVLATWDDHDYGVNDGGAEYPMKKESQEIFLDFFEVPKDDVRRSRAGVYFAQVFGPAGKRVQVILLDGRYFRSALKTGFRGGEPGEGFRGKYLPNTDPSTTILGEAQWRWLEEQLKQPAELRIIGSGIQVVADEHGSETWGNFPHERRRLFKLIQDTKANGVVFLSGDRHLAEIARLPAEHALGVGYPFYDITSSSLNLASGNFSRAGTRFANEINSYRVGLTYFETNFGTVHIDWDEPDPVVRLQVRDEKGAVVLQQRTKLSQLVPQGK